MVLVRKIKMYLHYNYQDYFGLIFYFDDKYLLKAIGNLGENCTNNTAEYFPFIISLILFKILNIQNKIIFFSDSQLLVNQINGKYKVSTPHIALFKYIAMSIILELKYFNIFHIKREFNTQVDKLANKGSMHKGKCFSVFI